MARAIAFFLLLPAAASSGQVRLACAGFGEPSARVAAKSPVYKVASEGHIKILVVYGKFKGEYPEQDTPPAWVHELFDPERRGGVSHFFKTMSNGVLTVDAIVAPGYYESLDDASTYVHEKPNERGYYARFSHEVLKQADDDVDFRELTNNGPDGIPDSRDDDRYADAVFIVLQNTPPNFLVGPATGIASWGWYSDFVSKDMGTRHFEIRVSSERVFVLQGGSFSEAAGVLSHEFGHLLGLPDLFNLDYAIFGGDSPANDSAGIGAWGLMGWGALGWNGNDGPNSFTGWSLRELGWLEPIRPTRRVESLRLEPVMSKGQVYEVLLPNAERFLIENRQRGGTFYDRNIPGEGLLIWHEDPFAEGPNRLDLECADGKWQTAGYPQGSVADVRVGEDNLDFWAHDRNYANRHVGNLGDATDPFDGLSFRAFTPMTNPDAYSRDRKWGISVEDIRIDRDNVATARIRSEPIALSDVLLIDEDGDGVLIGNERGALGFELAISSQLSQQLKVVLTSSDPLVRIVDPEVVFQPTNGYSVSLPADPGYDRFYNAVTGRGVNGIPTLEFTEEIEGLHPLAVTLNMYWVGDDDWELAWAEDFTIDVISVSRPNITGLAVVDDGGNGDGRAQVGEFIRLALQLHSVTELLRGLKASIRSLDEGVVGLGSERLRLLGEGDETLRVTESPEFLVTTAAGNDRGLAFEVTFDNGSGVWIDTLEVPLEPGADSTSPRVLPLLTGSVSNGLSVVLPLARIDDGSELASVSATLYRSSDSTAVATVPLEPKGDHYEAVWTGAVAGSYLVRGSVEDALGNRGDTEFRPAVYRRQLNPLPGGVVELELGAPVTGLDYAANGEWVAVAHGNEVRIYDPQTLLPRFTLRSAAAIGAVHFSPRGLLATGDEHGDVHLWDVRRSEEMARFQHRGAVTELVLSADASLLAAASAAGVRVWDLESSTSVAELDWGAPRIQSLAFHPDGRFLVAGRFDGSLSVWWSQPPYQQRTIAAHDGVEAVAFDERGSWMATGSRDRTIKLWDMERTQFAGLRTLKEHEDWVTALSFAPDLRTLVSASVDGTILIRDLDRPSAEPIALRGVGGVRNVAIGPEGTQLVSGTWNGTVQFWQLWDPQSEPQRPLPRHAVFLPSYPNPFNSGVQIPFRLFRGSAVRIEIYDVTGQLVRVLDAGTRDAGLYQAGGAAYWDGRNQSGAEVASGLYVALLSAGDQTLRQKLMLLR